MIVRWVAAAAMLGLAPAGVVPLANHAVDRLGTELGARAASLVAHLPAKPSREPVPAPIAEPPCSPVESAAWAAAPAKVSAGRRGPRGPRKGGARSPAPRGIYVSSAAVLRLAQASAMPHAVPVGVSGPRPAGLRLVGVSGLGIGMRDGDVLTKVMGSPALSVADVIGRVLAARSQRAPKVFGEFWRAGEVWNLVVEQPYVPSGAPPSTP